MSERARAATRLWAAIVTPFNGRGHPWIHYYTVRGTRREAKRAFLENYRPEHQRAALKNVRFARVTITEDDHA